MIELNAAEQKLARYLAESRYRNARKLGKPNMRMGGQSDEQTDIEGVGAEIAYCKMMNVYPDTEIAADLPPEDAVLPDGRLVDVKVTKYQSGRLLVTLKKKAGDVDLYVLLIGEFPKYRIVGQMESAEIIQESRIGDLGKGATYIANQNELEKAE